MFVELNLSQPKIIVWDMSDLSWINHAYWLGLNYSIDLFEDRCIDDITNNSIFLF